MLSLSVLTIQPKSTLFMKFLKLCELWTVSVCFHSWCKDCFFLGISFWIFLTDAGGCTGQAEAAGNRLLLPVWKWISQFNQVHILIFRLLSQTNLFKGITDINQVLCPFIKCWSLSKFLFSHGYTVLLSMEMQLWLYIIVKYFWDDFFHTHTKHRKNCECCPGYYLIVNHYSSI